MKSLALGWWLAFSALSMAGTGRYNVVVDAKKTKWENKERAAPAPAPSSASPTTTTTTTTTKTRKTASDVDGMRSRELRKLLIKLGYGRKELKQIIDKAELRRLAKELLAEEAADEAAALARSRAWRVAAAVGALGALYLLKEPALVLLYGLQDWFRGQSYQTTLRIKLVRKSIEQRYLLATLALVLATVIDVVMPTLNVSIILSWFIPHGSVFRRFLIPMPNFSITLNTVLGMRQGSASRSGGHSRSVGVGSGGSGGGWSHSIGDYGLNVAPMIIMTLCSWAKQHLENYGASSLMADASAKNKRKEERHEAKARQQAETEAEARAGAPAWGGGGGGGYEDEVLNFAGEGFSFPDTSGGSGGDGDGGGGGGGGIDEAAARRLADAFLSRPIAARGPPPPNLPFAEPLKKEASKAPSIGRLHFAQPVSFGGDAAGAAIEAAGATAGAVPTWHLADDEGFWDQDEDGGGNDDDNDTGEAALY